MDIDFTQAWQLLKDGKIGVIPTDTIYGVVGSALNKNVVERLYNIKKRYFQKPMIILIESLDNLLLFDIYVGDKVKTVLSKLWPGKVSVILPCDSEKFAYLHRGTGTLAFRLPDNEKLLELIKNTGPLLVPSANPEGLKPAKNIKEAKNYFGDEADFYVDGGEIKAKPSTVVKIENGDIRVVRKGAEDVKKW